MKTKCDSCGTKVQKIDNGSIRFSNLESFIFNKKFDIGQKPMKNIKQQKKGQSIMVNPNSFKNVKEILHEYKILHGKGNDRHWIVLGCNGSPFRNANIVIQKEPEKCDWLYLVPRL